MRSRPLRSSDVSPPMPMRKCCGISKNRPGNNGRFVFVSQKFEENFCIPADQARKSDRSGRRAHTFQIASAVEKFVEQLRFV